MATTNRNLPIFPPNRLSGRLPSRTTGHWAAAGAKGKAMSKAYDEWAAARQRRADIVSANKSRLMRGQTALPLPIVPDHPRCPVAYQPDGTYEGVLDSPDNLPPGCVLRWELAWR